VRRGPSQEHGLIATVTDDALLVGMIGTIDEQISGGQETEGWVRVFGSSTLDGWTARRLLEEDGRCAPSTEDFEPTEVLARVAIRENDRAYEAFLAVDTRTVRLYETDAVCNLMERHVVRAAGAIADTTLTFARNRSIHPQRPFASAANAGFPANVVHVETQPTTFGFTAFHRRRRAPVSRPPQLHIVEHPGARPRRTTTNKFYKYAES
jgi:hypothetical protein